MLLSLSLLAAAPHAFAQDTSTLDDPAPAPATAQGTAPATAEAAPGKHRKFLMEVGFRGRYMDLPDSIMDLAYFRNNEAGAEVPSRPHVSAYSLGLEFVVKDHQANGIFYVEYLNPLIQPGYWDDKEEPPDHTDGSWLEPDKFGLVLIGANYAYELKANNWFSFLFGAGIGGAIKIGDLKEWQPGEDPANPDGTNDNADVSCGAAGTTDAPAYIRKDKCASDSVIAMPPAVPYLDVLLGPRFSIGDRATIRIEGGLHMVLPYGGASVGIVF